jgi:hypothetical protein
LPTLPEKCGRLTRKDIKIVIATAKVIRTFLIIETVRLRAHRRSLTAKPLMLLASTFYLGAFCYKPVFALLKLAKE